MDLSDQAKLNVALDGPAGVAFRRMGDAKGFSAGFPAGIDSRPTEGNDSGSRVRAMALFPDYQDSGFNMPIFIRGQTFQP
jgi:hypothetical protein